jgi:hypothetical protein
MKLRRRFRQAVLALTIALAALPWVPGLAQTADAQTTCPAPFVSVTLTSATLGGVTLSNVAVCILPSGSSTGSAFSCPSPLVHLTLASAVVPGVGSVTGLDVCVLSNPFLSLRVRRTGAMSPLTGPSSPTGGDGGIPGVLPLLVGASLVGATVSGRVIHRRMAPRA